MMMIMRTTIHIDDDIYKAAKDIADAENKSLGEVISSLARRALAPRSYATDADGIPSFVVSEGVSPMTPQMVKKAMEEE